MHWKERVRKEVDAAIREWNVTAEKLHDGNIRSLANLIADAMPSPDQRNGYVIVPLEAPPDAIEAGKWVHDKDGADCYRRMVRAAAAISR